MTIEASLLKATEKAVLLSVTVDTMMGQTSKQVWFPKSHTSPVSDSRVDVADWLLNSKYTELEDSVRGFIGFIGFRDEN